MSRLTRRYTLEFKNEAIKLALNRASIAQAASDLGIPAATLHNWVSRSNLPTEMLNKVEDPSPESSINIKSLLDKTRELQKRINRLEEEKAILKKAATYFGKEIW